MQSLFANVMACISFFPLFFFSPLLLFLFPSAKPLSHNKKASHSFALLFSPLRKKKVSLSQFHCSESPFASPISTKPLADMATSDPMAPSRSSSPLLASVHQHYTSEASTQSKTSTAATGHHKKKLAGQKRTPARTIGTQTEPHGYYQPRAKVLKISSSSRRPIKTDIVHDSRSCMFKVKLDSKGTLGRRLFQFYELHQKRERKRNMA
ncbi:hypothetical protein BX666DRAFT_768972 [Dichotomocladium elegans]|nr:hypothetical protein BX666DRAFT_768972 [Dichotomocladium elegans]